MWELLAYKPDAQSSNHNDDQPTTSQLSWNWAALFGVVAGILWGCQIALWPLVLLLGALLCLWLGRSLMLLLLLLVSLGAGYTSQRHVAAQPDTLAPWIGARVTLTGYWDGQFLSLHDPKARLALSPKPKVAAGQLKVAGILIRPSGQRTPNGFDQAAWMATQGGLFMATPKALLVASDVKEHQPVGGLRGWFRQGLRAGLPERQADLMQAIGTGDRNELDDEQFTSNYSVRDAFARSGLAHVMALSGQNVALITGCLIWLLALLGAPPALRYGLPATLLVPYLLVLVNISPSITRAVIMGLAVLLALLIGRGRLQLLDVLAFAGLVCLLLFPMWLFDIGLQLSFLAVLALNYSQKLAERWPASWPLWLRLPLAATLLAQLGTLPVIAHNFGQVPLLGSLIANLLAGPLMALLVPLSFMAGLLGPLAISINWLTGWLASALLWLAEFFGRFAVMPWGSISMAGFVAYAVFGLAGVWWLTGKIRSSVLLGACLLLMIFSYLPSLAREREVVFLDVGQGDATLLRLAGSDILIDGGGTPRSDYDVGARTVLPALRALGVRKLDVVVATHADTDHIEGLVSVLAGLPVGELWIGHDKSDDLLFAQLLGTAYEQKVPVRQVQRGDFISTPTGRLTVLWPTGKAWSTADNENSVALRLEAGKQRMAFLGDLPDPTEEYLGLGHLTLLKAAHHGSRHSTSAALLAETRPHDIIISVGRNNYGHPSQQLLERLKDAKVTVWRTDELGTVRWPLR